MTVRKLSIFLWVAALALGFAWALHRKPNLQVVLMVVVPSGGALESEASKVATALDDQVGQEGLSPELRVLTRHFDVPEEQAELRRVGFPEVPRLLCGVVDSDARDRTVRLVERFETTDMEETAPKAVAVARQWAER